MTEAVPYFPSLTQTTDPEACPSEGSTAVTSGYCRGSKAMMSATAATQAASLIGTLPARRRNAEYPSSAIRRDVQMPNVGRNRNELSNDPSAHPALLAAINAPMLRACASSP